MSGTTWEFNTRDRYQGAPEDIFRFLFDIVAYIFRILGNILIWICEPRLIRFYSDLNKHIDKLLMGAALYVIGNVLITSAYGGYMPSLLRPWGEQEFYYSLALAIGCDLVQIAYVPLRFVITVADMNTGKEFEA